MKNKVAIIIILISTLNCMSAEFRICIADSMDKIFKDGSNSVLENSRDAVFIDMAKDEQESFQLVVIPVESDLKRVKVSAQFISDASNLRLDLYKVGYVKTGNPGYPVEHIGLWPDILWPIDDFDVACDEVQRYG